MSADDGRPSRAGYWVGGGVAVLGVVGAVLWFVLMLTSFTNEIKGFERVPADGEPRQVTLSRTGSYTAYYEPSSGSLDDESDHSVDAEVVGPNGRNVVLEPYVSKLTYALGGHNGRAVFTFRVDAPGTYEVRSSSTGEGELAIGRGLGRKLLASILGGFAIGIVGLGLGAVVLIVTAVRRATAPRRGP